MASKLEERFARSLASNDTKTRTRALKRLTQWIAARSTLEDGFTELEMLKLWKGLYMCMWHSDKPLVQEELAECIAQLLQVIKRSDVALMFLRTFFSTIGREWHSIDRLRLDKFYMLIRKVTTHSFRLLSELDWDKELVEMFVAVIEYGPLNADVNKTSLGIQLHMLDVYLPELLVHTPVGNSLELLRPCLRLLANTRNTTVADCVCVNVLDPLQEEDTLGQLQLTDQMMADSLRELAHDRDTVGRNRKLIYTHCKRFSGAESELPTNSGCGLPSLKRAKTKLHKKKKRSKVKRK